jgi:hypothetical protein
MSTNGSDPPRGILVTSNVVVSADTDDNDGTKAQGPRPRLDRRSTVSFREDTATNDNLVEGGTGTSTATSASVAGSSDVYGHHAAAHDKDVGQTSIHGGHDDVDMNNPDNTASSAPRVLSLDRDDNDNDDNDNDDVSSTPPPRVHRDSYVATSVSWHRWLVVLASWLQHFAILGTLYTSGLCESFTPRSLAIRPIKQMNISIDCTRMLTLSEGAFALFTRTH